MSRRYVKASVLAAKVAAELLAWDGPSPLEQESACGIVAEATGYSQYDVTMAWDQFRHLYYVGGRCDDCQYGVKHTHAK